MPDTSFNFGHNVPAQELPWSENAESADSPQVDITCNQVLKMLRQLTETVRKANRTAMSNNSAPAPTQAEGNGDFAPFLKINLLLKDKVVKMGQKFTMQILHAKAAEKRDFSDVFVDVKIGGKEYTWGLSTEKKAYAALYEKFGANLDRWKGSVKCEVTAPYKKGYNPSIVVL